MDTHSEHETQPITDLPQQQPSSSADEGVRGGLVTAGSPLGLSRMTDQDAATLVTGGATGTVKGVIDIDLDRAGMVIVPAGIAAPSLLSAAPVSAAQRPEGTLGSGG